MRWCTVLLEVNASFLVIFVQLWIEELLKHVQIHDTGNGRLVVKLFLKHPVYEAADLCINGKKGRRRKNQQVKQVHVFVHY